MGHRLQITIEDEQYERLRAKSGRTGASIAELVRRAIDQAGRGPTLDEKLALIDESFGAWAGRGPDDQIESSVAYVNEIRGRRTR